MVESAKYHNATSELVSLAGHGKDAGFAEEKRNCEIGLDDFKHAVDAMRAHKAQGARKVWPGSSVGSVSHESYGY
jgi:hypothetical protein